MYRTTEGYGGSNRGEVYPKFNFRPLKTRVLMFRCMGRLVSMGPVTFMMEFIGVVVLRCMGGVISMGSSF